MTQNKLDWEDAGDGDWHFRTRSELGTLVVQRDYDGLYRAYWDATGQDIGRGRFRTLEKALAVAEKSAEKQIRYLCKVFGYTKKKVRK